MKGLRPRKVKHYGWRPDTPDVRDRKPTLTPGSRPKKVDLRSSGFLNFPVYDQGQLGSCTANAIAAAIKYAELREGAADPTKTDPSRLAIYWYERFLEGSTGQDAGAEIRDGLKVVAKMGYYDEKLWPYRITKFAAKPPALAANAEHVYSYYRGSGSTGSLRYALANGWPVIFGFTVYDSFGSVTPMPGPGEGIQGGHATLAVGYDDATKLYTVRNSWGASWGDGGYFTIPYAYLADPNLASDFWVIKKET